MISTLLIANRGEIACRIARTAKNMGIKTIAVYSSVDREALHVKRCDAALSLAGATASNSYLDQIQIINAAKQSGAQAIHPGYGFLSENAEFAALCEQNELIFVGPRADSIKTMGVKSTARLKMIDAGVAVLPGYDGDEQSDQHLKMNANAIGFPLLIKAVSGGGGKGMRTVNSAEEFDTALHAVKRESASAFSDDRVLLEKFLPVASHIEVQIFTDMHGNIVHLFERDCSLQRRHQKVLEESPGPAIDSELRNRMSNAAIKCAHAIDYVGAGTVEFLLAPDNDFYFMEMNTRLQVEHPVTEMVTGEDLVEWQLRIACGEPLPRTQSELTIKGHAIEARIYAENPDNQFLPATGDIEYIHHPNNLNDVRVDSGIQSGDTISTYYDPMISKVIAWGNNRAAALQKLSTALNQYEILGVKNNISFLSRLIQHSSVQTGQSNTTFIDNNQQELINTAQDPSFEIALACACCFLFLQNSNKIKSPKQNSLTRNNLARNIQDPWVITDGWSNGIERVFYVEFEHNKENYQIGCAIDGDQFKLSLPGGDASFGAILLDENHLRLEKKQRYMNTAIAQNGSDIFIQYAGKHYEFRRVDKRYQQSNNSQQSGTLNAPMPGTIISVAVENGQQVFAGESLLIMEAMKMEHQIKAPVDGEVKAINFSAGDQVKEGDALMVVE